MPRKRFSNCRRSTEKEAQIRIFQLKEEEVGPLPIYARGELGRQQLFVGTVDNWAAEMAAILGLCLQSSLRQLRICPSLQLSHGRREASSVSLSWSIVQALGKALPMLSEEAFYEAYAGST